MFKKKDEYESDEYDDNPSEVSVSSDSEEAGEPRRAISCEIVKKTLNEHQQQQPQKKDQQQQQADGSSKSLFDGPQSLFSVSKSSKPKTHLVTINLSESALHRLVHSALNTTTTTTTTNHVRLKTFRDLFDLNKFNGELFDYATYFACRKQLEQTAYKASEPLCLLNLESSSSSSSSAASLLGELEYDEYLDTASVLGDDHFSVQSSFDVPPPPRVAGGLYYASFYVASACQRRKRPIRNSNQFGSLLAKDMLPPSPKVKYQVRLNENRADSPTGKTL